jgi:hypothetical protein
VHHEGVADSARRFARRIHQHASAVDRHVPVRVGSTRKISSGLAGIVRSTSNRVVVIGASLHGDEIPTPVANRLRTLRV